MPTLTTNYLLQKPLVNDPTDEDRWGDELNDDLDDVDSLLRQGICNTIESSQTTGFTATASISVRKLYPCNATGAAFAATLPTAASAGNGATVAFKKTDASVNAITITRASSDTIDGATTQAVSSQYDCYVLVSDGVSNWNILSEPSMTIPDASTTVKGIIEIATNAEVTTATDTTRAVVPSSVNSHPGVAKAWVVFSGTTGTVAVSHNITSVVRNTTGKYTVTFTTAFSSVNYVAVPVSTMAAIGEPVSSPVSNCQAGVGALTATTCEIFTGNSNASGAYIAEDALTVYASFYGTQ